MPEKPHNFWQELKRRKVIRVITVYAAAAFVILELVDIVAPSLGLPPWTLNLVIVLLCIGFILSIILSWVYDITPDGIQKTASMSEFDTGKKGKESTGWKISTYASVLIIIAFVTFYIISNIRKSSDISRLEKSIAVLPFENWNSDAEYAHMGDAIANEINTQLATIHEFHIISYTSSSQYKGSDKPSIPQIGQELGVNFIIEGTIERQSDEVSIHVQVIQALNDDHLWAEEFIGKWNEIFSVRANIAKKVAEELKTILSPDEIERIEQHPTDNLEAYDYYLLGIQYSEKNTEEAVQKAISLYVHAIELDPKFAQAYIKLGKSYRNLFVRANWLPDRAFEQASNAVSKALEINDQLAEAYELRGLIEFEYDWDLKAAQNDLRKALELNPNLASSLGILGDLLNVSGHYDESFQYMKKAVKLDPNTKKYHNYLGYQYYLVGKIDSAINYLQNRIAMDSTYYNTHYWMGMVYLGTEEYVKAIHEFKQVVQYDSISQHYQMFLGIAYAKAGMLEETRNQLKILEDLEEESRTVSFGRAALLAELGEFESAIYWLQRSYEERGQWIFYIKQINALFSTMRSDPGFIEIYNKIYANIE